MEISVYINFGVVLLKSNEKKVLNIALKVDIKTRRKFWIHIIQKLTILSTLNYCKQRFILYRSLGNHRSHERSFKVAFVSNNTNVVWIERRRVTCCDRNFKFIPLNDLPRADLFKPFGFTELTQTTPQETSYFWNSFFL